MENLFSSRPSKEEDLKLIYELQEEMLQKDRNLKKAEEDMEYYKNTLLYAEDSYNKVFGANPKVGNLNPIAKKETKDKGNVIYFSYLV